MPMRLFNVSSRLYDAARRSLTHRSGLILRRFHQVLGLGPVRIRCWVHARGDVHSSQHVTVGTAGTSSDGAGSGTLHGFQYNRPAGRTAADQVPIRCGSVLDRPQIAGGGAFSDIKIRRRSSLYRSLLLRG